MSNQNFMIDARLIPDEDHVLLLEKVCGGSLSLGTVHSYTNSHRLGLGALDQHNSSLLEVPVRERYSGPAVKVIVSALEDRLAPIDVISTLRQIRHVAEILTGIRHDSFDVEISRVRDAAIAAGTLGRPLSAQKGVPLDGTLPSEYSDAIVRFKEGVRIDGLPLAVSSVENGLGHLSQYLGVMERADVPWREMSLIDLMQKVYFDLLAEEWCPEGKGTQRINQLVFMLKRMCPLADFACASQTMAECRARVIGSNASKNHKKGVSIDGLPREDAERFAFACPEYATKRGMTRYSPNDNQFEFDGRLIRLEKVPAREVTQEGFLSALRAMISMLHEHAPEMVDLPTDDRDYDFIALEYYKRYESYQSSSLAARMDSLLGVLRRILPSTVNITRLESLTMEARSAVDVKAVVVPKIQPTEVRDLAISAAEESYKRYHELQVCPKPYMSPKWHLLLLRDSLIVAFLATEPLRRNSLRQFNEDDMGEIDVNGVSFKHVQIDESRMKNAKVHDFVVDSVLEPWITLYVEEIRSTIAPSYEGQALWVSTWDMRMSNGAISRLVRRASTLLTGVLLRPHDFRRIIATYEIPLGGGRRRLGHLWFESTEKYEDPDVRAQVCRISSLKKTGDAFWSA